MICISTLFLWACGSLPSTQKSSNQGDPVKVTLPLVTSVQKGDPSAGVRNLRFRFSQDFVLTLAEDVDGNGVRKVTPQGNIELLSETTVRFPVDKLGKFVSGEQSMLYADKAFKITFEDDQVSSSPELGLPVLRAEYDTLGVMRVAADFLVKGKPAVKYQNAVYLLPDNYKTIDIVVGQEGKGRQRVVRGVKTPAQGG